MIGRTVPVERFVLLTTIDALGGREAELRRLIGSIGQFRRERPDLDVVHRLLVQRCPDDEAAAYAASVEAPSWLHIATGPDRVPLSAARNRLLAMLAADKPPGRGDLIAFPDDDAWYADGTLARIVADFEAEPMLDLWFARYGSTPSCSAVPVRTPRVQQVVSFASSNTIVLRGQVLRAVGGFDETLGLGTPARGGEDTEFALRAWLAARRAGYVPAALIGHRPFDPALRARYYAGALIAIAHHAPRSRGIATALVRKLAVGGVLALRGELGWAQMREVIALWRDRRRVRRAAAPRRGRVR